MLCHIISDQLVCIIWLDTNSDHFGQTRNRIEYFIYSNLNMSIYFTLLCKANVCFTKHILALVQQLPKKYKRDLRQSLNPPKI